MASRWRKAISNAISALLISVCLVFLPNTSALAIDASAGTSCLIINDQNELVSADFCTGDVVVPARVTKIKSHAFFYFTGAVSFEANSQLTTIETGAFGLGVELKSIILPPSLISVGQRAIVPVGRSVLYVEGAPTDWSWASVWQSALLTLVQPRGNSRPSLFTETGPSESPFQIDCNTLPGDKDLFGQTYVALELHNCLDPRNPTAGNPPARLGYILNEGINNSVALQSVDGAHHAVVRFRQLGGSLRLAATQEISGSGFSISAFGDQFDPPQNSGLTCQLASGTLLPAGVALTSDCKLEAASTSSMVSSTTDITINWVAHNGVANFFDVEQNQASPVEDMNSSGSVSVRLSLRKTSDLTSAQLFQMKLLTAKFSGTIRDWNSAVDAYQNLPLDQIPVGNPDAGILASAAVRQFELGSVDETAATNAVNLFAGQVSAQSSFLDELKSRRAIQSTANAVVVFESSGVDARAVRQQILALPASAQRDALLDRFTGKARTFFGRHESSVDGVRTLVFKNPYAVEQFTVPDGVTQLRIQVQGAEGSQGGFDRGSTLPDRTGFKGQIQGTVSVAAGQVLTIGVGEAAGNAPADCLNGISRIALDTKVAIGGSNPLGGYSGGNGGSPGYDDCSGYGGAGGAASVIQIADSSQSAGLATLVAGGSAGSTGSSDRYKGLTGLQTFEARADQSSTSGQSALALWSYTYPDWTDFPSDGGGDSGAGGGAIGGKIGGYNMDLTCGFQDYCPLASSPGSNSTAGIQTLSASYVSYSFNAGENSNGLITISFVEPPAMPHAGGGSDGPTPTPTTTPSAAPGVPGAPSGIKAVPFWKGADVSWAAPVDDGDSPITSYEVATPQGVKCSTTKLSCRLTGLSAGQLLEVSVRAKNSAGLGPEASIAGSKVFIPLSLNLWQIKPFTNLPKAKLLTAAQLRTLGKMLTQDNRGFKLSLSLARNSSKLTLESLRRLLTAETRALSGQLRAAGLANKVTIQAAILPPNSKAKRPSFSLLVRKP